MQPLHDRALALLPHSPLFLHMFHRVTGKRQTAIRELIVLTVR